MWIMVVGDMFFKDFNVGRWRLNCCYFFSSKMKVEVWIIWILNRKLIMRVKWNHTNYLCHNDYSQYYSFSHPPYVVGLKCHYLFYCSNMEPRIPEQRSEIHTGLLGLHLLEQSMWKRLGSKFNLCGVIYVWKMSCYSIYPKVCCCKTPPSQR